MTAFSGDAASRDHRVLFNVLVILLDRLVVLENPRVLLPVVLGEVGLDLRLEFFNTLEFERTAAWVLGLIHAGRVSLFRFTASQFSLQVRQHAACHAKRIPSARTCLRRITG